MSQTGPIPKALELPSGARFYRCALQVNPFEYLSKQQQQTAYTNETDYNAAIVQACQENSIEVIATMDHYRVTSSESLRKAAEDAGIHVFPGFEAVTKDGVHILCLFDADRDVAAMERIIGDCGVHDDSTASPVGQYDVEEFLEKAKSWGAICIAAHVAMPQGGLLGKLSGQPRVHAWRSPHLLACAISGAVKDAREDLRPILENKNADHRRQRPVAVVNARDVNGPEDVSRDEFSCLIKMSEVSVEGLRQAFLDPESRIRLSGDPEPEEHTEMLALAWQGGFLDDAAIHFNENLNVLVGGRGTGKSTIVESLRYVLGLEPLGEEATKAHEGIVRRVLGNGTKISLLIRSHRPSKREYLIERTVPNPSVVRDNTGTVLTLTPGDVIPQVEVYGQHEISELSKSAEKRTRLLDRFVEVDPGLVGRKRELRRELEKSRDRILDVHKEMKQIEERLAALPAIEEQLKRFKEAGLEEQLKERSLIVREEQVLRTASERVGPFNEVLEQLKRELPIDCAFLSDKALEGLPGIEILAEGRMILERLSQDLGGVATEMEKILKRADDGLVGVRGNWEKHKKSADDAYEKILRELQKSKVDGAEFIRVREQIEELRPLKEKLRVFKRDEGEHGNHRRNLLAEWEDVKSEEFRRLTKAAKKVSKQLVDRVRVKVTAAGNRSPLSQLLRDRVGGRLSEAIDVLESCDDFSLSTFAAACRKGRDDLAKEFGIPPAQAERIVQASADVVMQIEELDLSPTTEIELNVAGEDLPAVWQKLDELSTGQKATAVLLLLLLESDAPLIVDQPEDDLDNRFITDCVVPKMREEKRLRQFVFATHNANIPVLGDADLILGLKASGEAGQGKAEIPVEHMGSIDAEPVRDLVEELLEGGKDAFEMRRLKYGF